jgi:hypothetical protein
MRTNKSLSECQAVLGLVPGASAAQIRQAYLALVKKWHPDRFPGNQRLRLEAEEKLKTINEAYAVLRNYRPPSASSATYQAYSKPSAYNRPGSAGERPRYNYTQARSTYHAASEPPRYNQASSTSYYAHKSSNFSISRRKIPSFVLWLPIIFLFGNLLRTNANFAQPSFPAVAQSQSSAMEVIPVGSNFSITKETPHKKDPAHFAFPSLKPKPIEIKLHDAIDQNSGTPVPIAATAVNTGSFKKTFATSNVSNKTPLDPVFITVGSTKEQVKAIQGEPTTSTEDEWVYERSSIHFFDGRVVSWSHGLGSPLKVIGVPESR